MLMMTESPTVMDESEEAEGWPETSATASRDLTREPGRVWLWEGVAVRPFPSPLPKPSQALESTSTGDGGILLAVSAGLQAARRWYLAFTADAMQQSARTYSSAASMGAPRFMASVMKSKAPHLEAIQWLQDVTGLSQERVGVLIGVSRQTLNRWERGEAIADPNLRRVFAVREVLNRALKRNPSRERLVEWLYTPRGAEGQTPFDLLADGQIDRARLLALSAPSARLAWSPAWVYRPVPAAFRAGAEHRQEVLPPDDAGEPDAPPNEDAPEPGDD